MNLVAARRDRLLSASGLTDSDKRTLRSLPVFPDSLFGPYAAMVRRRAVELRRDQFLLDQVQARRPPMGGAQSQKKSRKLRRSGTFFGQRKSAPPKRPGEQTQGPRPTKKAWRSFGGGGRSSMQRMPHPQ